MGIPNRQRRIISGILLLLLLSIAAFPGTGKPRGVDAAGLEMRWTWDITGVANADRVIDGIHYVSARTIRITGSATVRQDE
jgi:hypothetical protein